MPSRRALLSSVGAASVALAGCAASATQRVTGRWPQFGRTAANGGTTTARGPVETVRERWTADLKLPLRKTPVVAGGRVFVGGLDRFVAFDAATGEADWRVPIPESQRFNDRAAAVGDGTVVAGFDGALRAFDAATGEEVWTTYPGDGIGAPTLRDGTLYVPVAETGRVEARSLADGSRTWRTRVGEWIPGPVALAGDTVVAAGAGRDTSPGTLHGLDAATGATRWALDLAPEPADDDSVDGDPTGVSVGDGRAYVGLDDGSVWTVRVRDGERVWRFDPGTTITDEAYGDPDPRQPPVRAPPAVGDGRVYVPHGDARLYALDAATGEQAWSFWAWNHLPAQPSVGDGAVYVGCEDSFVYALDPATGERLWEFSTQRYVESAPSVVDGHLFVASADEHVYALGGGR
jgi:outer membrane protein assembly factor BamB